MTAGITVGIDAKGGAQAAADIARVERATLGVAAAEQKTAAAAKARGHAQQEANRAGAGGGLGSQVAGGFKFASLIGGDAGHEFKSLGKTIGRAGAFGAGGLAFAAAGMVINGLATAINDYGQGFGRILEATQSISAKIKAARESSQDAALSYATANSLGLHRAMTAGVSAESLQAGAQLGLTPESMAKISTMRDSGRAFGIAGAARQFGMDSNASIDALMKYGEGTGDKYDRAADLAGRAQDRNIGRGERANARFIGESGISPLDKLDAYTDATNAVAASGALNGKAQAAASRKFATTASPEASAIAAAMKEGNDKSEVLQKIADNTFFISQVWTEFMHLLGGGDRGAQAAANQFMKEQSAAMAAAAKQAHN